MYPTPTVLDKEHPYLHVHYRAVQLQLNPDQRAAVERFFGMVRMVTNNLLLKTKDYPDSLARSKEFTIEELEQETLRFMNESDYPPFKEGLLTPGILKGILVAWLSEWNDFRHRRIERPKFHNHGDPQRFYIIDTSAVEYTNNNFKILHCPDIDLYLRSSKYPVSNKAPVHLIKRNENGEYWLYSLHEFVRYTASSNQDEVLNAWCSKILTIERELKINRRRYLTTSGARRSDRNQESEHVLMTLRKITLDRLLRAREARIHDHIAEAANQEAA